MSVYVDVLHDTAPTPQWRFKKSCHMIADSIPELHDFASRLGLKRSWFQGDHYDLTETKRRLAVKLGAKEVSRTEFVLALRRLRGQGPPVKLTGQLRSSLKITPIIGA